jgi:hypothetical protein
VVAVGVEAVVVVDIVAAVAVLAEVEADIVAAIRVETVVEVEVGADIVAVVEVVVLVVAVAEVLFVSVHNLFFVVELFLVQPIILALFGVKVPELFYCFLVFLSVVHQLNHVFD